MVVGVVKAKAECGECAEAEVVGGAAADAEEEGARAASGGVADEFAGAERGRLPRIAPGLGEQGEAGGTGHFDEGHGGIGECRMPIFDFEEGHGGGRDVRCGHETDQGDDGFAAGARDGEMLERAVGGGDEDFAEALAAVGERAEVESPVGVDRAQGLGGEGAGLRGGEGVLEFIEGEQCAHGPAPCGGGRGERSVFLGGSARLCNGVHDGGLVRWMGVTFLQLCTTHGFIEAEALTPLVCRFVQPPTAVFPTSIRRVIMAASGCPLF